MHLNDFNYSEHIEALLEYIKKYWNIRAIPKGYKAFCDDYTDFKGQGEDETALYEEFKGHGDGGTCSFGFPTRVSLPHVAYDDICQGRNPLNTLIGAVMAYGMIYGQRYEEVNENSTMNYRMKFASFAMESMVFHRYTSLDHEKADLKEQEWKDYMDVKIDMHETMDKYRDLSRKLTKKRALIQLKHCFGSHKSFHKGLRKGGRIIITKNKKLKRRGPLWSHLFKLMGGGQSKDNPFTTELKKELREYGIVLTGKKSRRSMMSPDIYIFTGLKGKKYGY
jgi:hypothetical protein